MFRHHGPSRASDAQPSQPFAHAVAMMREVTLIVGRRLSCVAADVVLSRLDIFTAEEFRPRKRGKSDMKEVRCSLSPM